MVIEMFNNFWGVWANRDGHGNSAAMRSGKIRKYERLVALNLNEGGSWVKEPMLSRKMDPVKLNLSLYFISRGKNWLMGRTAIIFHQTVCYKSKENYIKLLTFLLFCLSLYNVDVCIWCLSLYAAWSMVVLQQVPDPPGTWKLDYIVLDFQDLIYALHKWSPLLQISIDKHMRMSIALSDMGQSGRVLIVKACKKICVEDFYDFSR